MAQYDSIIIGSGINSLVIAAILGKKGKKVLALEARSQIGGLSSSMEFSSGYNCNMIHDNIKWIDLRVLKELDLKNHGLKMNNPTLKDIKKLFNTLAMEIHPDKPSGDAEKFKKLYNFYRRSII